MISIPIRFALIVLLLKLSGPLWADDFKGFQINGKPVPSVVATVNGTKITANFLKGRIENWRRSSKQQGLQITPIKEERFARNTIGQAIEQELLYQKSKDLNIKIESKAIQQEVDNIQAKFPDHKMFLAALAFQHLSLEKLKERIEKQLTEDELIRREIAPQAHVTDGQIKAYYNQNKDSFSEPKKYGVSHIFTAKVNAGNPRELESPELQKKAGHMIQAINEEAREKITIVFNKLSDGADFVKMVNQFSEDDSTKSENGSIGEIYMHQIDPVFAAVISRLVVKGTSDVVEHKDGFHIFKLNHVKPEKLIPLKDVEADILNILLRKDMEKKKNDYVSGLKKKAEIKIFL